MISMAENQLKFNGSLWVELGDVPVLEPGRVELLERIEKTGSIRQAVLQMEMSYAQAWKLIDHMNTHLGEPVVISYRGGKGGGKAEVTAKGKKVMTEFEIFYQKFRDFLQESSAEISL